MNMERSNNWIEYWNSNNIWNKSNLWKKNAEILLNSLINTSKEISIDNDRHQPFFAPSDNVLEIGCGPGFLVDLLKDRVKKIVCVDTADNYVKICRLKFKNNENVVVHKLGQEYTKLSFLNEKFSKLFQF